MRRLLFGRHSYIVFSLIIFLLCFSLGLFAFLNRDVKLKEMRLKELNGQYSAVLQENEALSNLLNAADEREMFEQLARAHGYCYPDEKIYYDVTPGK